MTPDDASPIEGAPGAECAVRAPVPPESKFLIAGSLLAIAFLAVSRRPESDLANYRAIVEVVGLCSTSSCIMSAANDVIGGVLRDPTFSFLLAVFRGNSDVAVAVITSGTYLLMWIGILKILRVSGREPEPFTVAVVIASSLALVPITLGTHLMRQCLVSGIILVAAAAQSWRGKFASLGAAFAIHKGAAVIGVIAVLAPPIALLGGFPVWLGYGDVLLSEDTRSYALVENPANLPLIYVFAALCLVAYRPIRAANRIAARLVLAGGVLSLAMALAFNESHATTRTFTTSLIMALPATNVLLAARLRRLPTKDVRLVLVCSAVVMVAVSIFRDVVSPFSYDFSRWL